MSVSFFLHSNKFILKFIMNTGDTVLLHSKQETMQIQAYASMSVYLLASEIVMTKSMIGESG